MIATSADHILVHFVEPHHEGFEFEKTRMGWPLHITQVSWFLPEDEQRLYEVLAEVSEASPPFEAVIGPDTMLGSDHNIPVNVIANEYDAMLAHKALLKAVKDSGGLIADERWMGDSHIPHVTHHGDIRLYEGDVVRINDFSLVKRVLPTVCRIVKNFQLESAGA